MIYDSVRSTEADMNTLQHSKASVPFSKPNFVSYAFDCISGYRTQSQPSYDPIIAQGMVSGKGSRRACE